MSIRLSILLTSTLLACRSGSVKLGDENVDTASVSEPTGEPGGSDTAEPSDEPSDEPSSEPTSEPSNNVVDNDGDGFPEEEDCDDNDASINPDAEEVCDNGVDNNCDGVVDEDDPNVELSTWYQDADGDGYGDTDYEGYEVCVPPPGFVLDNTDCDDGDDTTNPGGSANEATPNQCMTDVDGDGYGEANPSNSAAVPGTDCDDNDASNVPTDADGDGFSGCTGDCDDSNANVNPSMDEMLWDGADNDCDGVVDQISAESYDSALTGASEDYLSFDNSISIVDVTADGTPDVFIGGSFVGNADDQNGLGYENMIGSVYMLDGSGYSSWDGAAASEAAATIEGNGAIHYFSSMSNNQGDINGDGDIDLAIGGTDAARGYTGYSDVGSAVFFGAGSLSGTYDAEDADITFTDAEANYGANRLSSNIDINGDGYSDVLISDYITGFYQGGTWRNGSSGCWSGQCNSHLYLFSGAELSSGDYSLYDDSTTVFEEGTNYDYFGQTITGADIDGDGNDELFVGAPGNDENASGAGCVLIYKGSEDIFTDANYAWEIDDIDFYLDHDNGAICGETEDARLGWNSGVVIADFNGDTVLDLAVAGPNTNQVFVFFDASSLFGGKADADTDADVVITAASGTFGYALAAGDMNGDGIDDLAIGAPDLSDPIGSAFSFYSLMNNGAPSENGMVYLYDGTSLAGEMSEEDADGRIYSEGADMFGITIVAEDMNGDNKDDLWIGAPYYDGDAGRASLYIMP